MAMADNSWDTAVMNTVSARKESDTVTISVKGSFNYDLLPAFREIYLELEPAHQFVIDLRQTDSIDSSALGILLNMQRHLDQPDGAIRIINASDTVKRVLQITRFDRKFRVE